MLRRSPVLVMALALFAFQALAEDAFYQVPLAKLTITAGSIPNYVNPPYRKWELAKLMDGRVLLAGEGEGYCQIDPLSQHGDDRSLQRLLVLRTGRQGHLRQADRPDG